MNGNLDTILKLAAVVFFILGSIWYVVTIW